MAVNPLVIKGAGVPGAADSYYSAQKSLSTPGTNAFTVVPEIGWIQVLAVANITWNIRVTTVPAYSIIVPANAPGMVWSDGTNIFVSKTTSGAGNALYFVLQHRP